MSKIILIGHKYILTLIIILFLLLLHSNSAFANTLLFFDDFNDGNADGWLTTYYSCSSNPPWQVMNIKYGVEINEDGCWTHSTPVELSISDNYEYVFEVDISFPITTSEDRNIIFKYKDIDNRYGLHFYGTNIHYEKIINGQGKHPHGTIFSFPFETNKEYHFKFEVGNNNINIHIHEINNESNYKLIIVSESPPTFQNQSIALRATSGGTPHSLVWFDNVEVKLIGPFELPFDHEGRLSENGDNFRNAFWGRMTAVFDHERKGGKHIPYTGELFKKNKCKKGDIGIECYDKHHGTDFDDIPNDPDSKKVFSVGDGEVVYASGHNEDGCTPEKGGFGCVVIVQYNNTPAGTVYGLYAHLSEIYSSFDSYPDVTESTQIGVMGKTGCKKCGEHLHFGVLKKVSDINLSSSTKMEKKDWQELLFTIQPQSTPNIKHYCTYRAPNRMRYAFLDPSGWRGSNFLYPSDPWQEACGVESLYLWKYDVGNESPESLSNFLHPIKKFLED